MCVWIPRQSTNRRHYHYQYCMKCLSNCGCHPSMVSVPLRYVLIIPNLIKDGTNTRFCAYWAQFTQYNRPTDTLIKNRYIYELSCVVVVIYFRKWCHISILEVLPVNSGHSNIFVDGSICQSMVCDTPREPWMAWTRLLTKLTKSRYIL